MAHESKWKGAKRDPVGQGLQRSKRDPEAIHNGELRSGRRFGSGFGETKSAVKNHGTYT
jgi:hypothetical protein